MTSEFDKWVENQPMVLKYRADPAHAIKAAFAEVERRANGMCGHQNPVCDYHWGLAVQQLQQEWFGGKSEG